MQNRKVEKKINIIGGIGKNERQNRDRYRVMRGGCCVGLCSHDDKEQPLVMKRWRKKLSESDKQVTMEVKPVS